MMGTLRQAGIQPGAEVEPRLADWVAAYGRRFAELRDRPRSIHPPVRVARLNAPRGAFAVSSDEVNWRAYLAEFHRERAGIAEAVLSALSPGTIRRTVGWRERCRRVRVLCSILRADQARCRVSWPSPGERSSVWICLSMSWRWL